jgi:hypothetical protein
MFGVRLLALGQDRDDRIAHGERVGRSEHRIDDSSRAPDQERAQMAVAEELRCALPVEESGGVPDCRGGGDLFRYPVLGQLAEQLARQRETRLRRRVAFCVERSGADHGSARLPAGGAVQPQVETQAAVRREALDEAGESWRGIGRVEVFAGELDPVAL